jgi:hypothetical protein
VQGLPKRSVSSCARRSRGQCAATSATATTRCTSRNEGLPRLQPGQATDGLHAHSEPPGPALPTVSQVPQREGQGQVLQLARSPGRGDRQEFAQPVEAAGSSDRRVACWCAGCWHRDGQAARSQTARGVVNGLSDLPRHTRRRIVRRPRPALADRRCSTVTYRSTWTIDVAPLDLAWASCSWTPARTHSNRLRSGPDVP